MADIDLVLLWVNTEDKKWRAELTNCSKSEPNFDNIRYRDYGTLKYILRGVEKNAPWIRKVHLILAYESQVPDWLNTECPKLEIHYHRDFIPLNLLPTFNSNCIELFLHRIPSLSNFYILFNDDQFIINKIDEKMFVDKDLPVFNGNVKKFEFRLNIMNTFKQTLDNNLKYVINYCTKHKLEPRQYKHAHLPEVHVKNFEAYMINEDLELFTLSLAESPFRTDKNFTNWLFSDLLQTCGTCVTKPELYKKSKYVKLGLDLNYQDLAKKQLICVNDDVKDDFFHCINNLKQFFESIYPDKSAFEN